MLQNRLFKSLRVISALLLLVFCGVPANAAGTAQNVVLIIADGQGYNTVAATDYFAGEAAVHETFPVKFGVSTYPHGGGYDPAKAWKTFDYVKNGATDSAAAATAMATGVKTYNEAIGVDINRNPVGNIVEAAEELGKATGVVASVPFSHATPAAMAVHNVDRDAYAAIANDMLKSGLDVIMGAGHPDFNDNGDPTTVKNYEYVGGQATWTALNNPADNMLDEWTLIDTEEEFNSLAAGTLAVNTDKICGVAQVRQTLQQKRSSGFPFNDNVPTLKTMALGALQVLSRDPDGFFLMVEGGAVDWANHSQQLGRMIEEELDFNDAVEGVVTWLQQKGLLDRTLLIVTADHETGHLWGPGSGGRKFKPIVNQGAGILPGATFYSTGHTNALVPLYARGPGSELLSSYADRTDPKRGRFLDNTEIFQVMKAAMGADAISAVANQ